MKKLSILTALLLPVFAIASEVIAPVGLTLGPLSAEAVKIEWQNGEDDDWSIDEEEDDVRGYKIYRNGLGIAILSTSKGVITDKEARKLNVGGEVICYVS